MSHEKVFTDIFESNVWGGRLSVSGTGSDPDQTRNLLSDLPRLLRKYGIRVMLDLPCGDYRWMQYVWREGVQYIGGDIVKTIIDDNVRQFTNRNTIFMKLDIMRDVLPAADMLMCRDCFVHMPFEDIKTALQNIVNSRISSVLMTTFTARESNKDIELGDWRPLNMCAPPFNLPPPIDLIVEGCTENYGRWSDKSLGLWNTEQLEEALK